MVGMRRLLRWFVSDLEPASQTAVVELYEEQSAKLSLKCFFAYACMKMVWLVVYITPSLQKGFDNAKWRAVVGQSIGLLVLTSMLAVAFKRHRKQLPIRLPRVVMILPTVLAIVSSTLHLESIRVSIDSAQTLEEGKPSVARCTEMYETWINCTEWSTLSYLAQASNISQDWGYQANVAAAKSCSKLSIATWAEGDGITAGTAASSHLGSTHY